MLALVGGVKCSEVAVDPHTTKILKADVTWIGYGVLGGVCWSIQCGIWQRDTPDVFEQGMLLSAGMARGWVFVKSYQRFGFVLFFGLLIEGTPL